MDTEKASKELSVTPGHRTYIFVLLFILLLVDQADRMVVSSLFPYIQKEWGISDMECGLLISTVYWSIVIFVFPMSILVDRWSRKKTIGILAILWSFASMACAFMGNFRQLFSARTMLGVGESGYGPGGTAMISWLYPVEKRARVLGIWNASQPLGMALGVALGGIIAANLGWRYAFGLVAAPGLIAAILFFFVKDYKTVPLIKTIIKAGTDEVSKVKMRASDVAKEFARTPTLILTYLGFAGVIFVTTSLVTWLPTYFHRVGGLPVDQASIKASIVMLCSMVGFFVGGFMSDAWVKKRLNSRLIYCAITTIISALLAFIAFSLFEGNIQYAVLLVMGVLITAFVPAAAAVTQEVIHPGLRAQSWALAIVFQNLLGGGLGPIVVGAISDATNLQTALLVLPASLVISAGLFFIGSFFYVRDFNKVEKIALEVAS
ncbi:MFS transporter [bacterium]|nr:MAG: MFS transporter [bacterium]